MAEFNALRTVAASGAAQTLTAAGAVDPVYDITLTANCTLTLAASQPTPARMQTITAYLRQDGTGNRVLTLPASGITWAAGTPPTFNRVAGRYDIIQFVTVDGGANWLVAVIAYGVITVRAPSAPTLSIASGDARNVVTISDTDNGGSPILSHKLYRGTTTSNLTLLATMPVADGNVYTDTAVTNGTAYYYEAIATNALGDSARSVQQSGTPAAGQALPTRLNFPQNNDSAFFTQQNAAYVPGAQTLDVRCRLSAPSIGGMFGAILGIWQNGSNQTWVLTFETGGLLRMRWFTAAGLQDALSSATPSIGSNVVGWVRAVVEPSTGVCTFYSSLDGSSWTQVGAPQTMASGNMVTSGSLTALVGGQYAGAGANLLACQIYECSVRVGGTVVTNPVFAGLAVGTTQFTDAQGKTWNIAAPAAITTS